MVRELGPVVGLLVLGLPPVCDDIVEGLAVWTVGFGEKVPALE